MKRLFLFYRLTILACLFALLVFNLINLNEFYGSGPPYYSRTTNMDKWSDPLPFLMRVDGVFILILVAIDFARRIFNRKQQI